MNRFLIVAISFPVLLLGVSCAPTKPTTSSFLQEPAQLKLDGKTRRYVSPKLSEVAFKKVYIEPITIQLEKEVFDEEQRGELSSYYKAELEEAFSEKYEVIQAPSNDSYFVRSAITGLNGANVVANAVMAVVAVPLDNGGASVETEILAGKSKERLYAEARSIAGGLAGKGGFKSRMFGYLSKTDHSRAALRTAAEDLVKELSPPAQTEG